MNYLKTVQQNAHRNDSVKNNTRLHATQVNEDTWVIYRHA